MTTALKHGRTRAAIVPGVRPCSLTAAERYEVRAEYQRFDQKMNVIKQRYWNPDAATLWLRGEEIRKAHVRAKRQGHSLLDWGFWNAAAANATLTGFAINTPNHGPTSWQPLGPLPEGVDKWEGSAETNSRAVKKIARIFGAGDVGITQLDRRWVYQSWFDDSTGQSHPIKFSDEPGYEHITKPTQSEDGTQIIPASMKYVVVMAVPMHRDGIRAAPTLTHAAAAMAAYSEIGRLIVSVAEFIRGLGYHAIPSSNCTALSIPLAIDAGLGELGRNGKLIHPVWGVIGRLCKVITDLPLMSDTPIETGATAFCERCEKCAAACPARAIPIGPRSYEPVGEFNNAGARVWQMNHRKCLEYWGKVGPGCGLCLVACPFSKGGHWSHQVTKAAIAWLPALDPLIVAVDDAFGYGRVDQNGFWSREER